MNPNSKRRKLLLLLALHYRQRNKRAKRKWWVKPISEDREEQGEQGENLIVEMRLSDPETYLDFFCMTPATFDELLSIIGPEIQKKDTFFRKAISPAQQLAVTLRFLASGDSMTSVSYSFHLGKSTVSTMIRRVCSALWNILMPLTLKQPNKQKWIEISEDFNKLWQFPNCVGAIDAKHILMHAPGISGAEFFNYKGTFSIVLMAVCDAQSKFTVIDIGAPSRQSDGGIFRNSSIGKAMESNGLDLPIHSPLPGSDIVLPYVFVGDEAFPLKENLMRPYPCRNISKDSSIYNYRLSRARRTIENAFGIMTSKFQIFRKPIIAQPETIESIIKATVCLHNFLKSSDERVLLSQRTYCTPGLRDFEDSTGVWHDGKWRSSLSSGLLDLSRTGSNMYGENSKHIRDHFKEYFCHAGALSWQSLNVTEPE